jgi:hypothetical protein
MFVFYLPCFSINTVQNIIIFSTVYCTNIGLYLSSIDVIQSVNLLADTESTYPIPSHLAISVKLRYSFDN